MSNGKGDKQRPTNMDKYRKNYDNIFRKKENRIDKSIVFVNKDYIALNDGKAGALVCMVKDVKQETVTLKETKRHQTEDKLSVEFVIEHTPFKNDITTMQINKMQSNNKALKSILNK